MIIFSLRRGGQGGPKMAGQILCNAWSSQCLKPPRIQDDSLVTPWKDCMTGMTGIRSKSSEIDLKYMFYHFLSLYEKNKSASFFAHPSPGPDVTIFLGVILLWTAGYNKEQKLIGGTLSPFMMCFFIMGGTTLWKPLVSLWLAWLVLTWMMLGP